jgi:hypothetical protein
MRDYYIKMTVREACTTIVLLALALALAGVINRTAHIRHQCRQTTVLSYHRYLINTGVEKMNNILI